MWTSFIVWPWLKVDMAVIHVHILEPVSNCFAQRPSTVARNRMSFTYVVIIIGHSMQYTSNSEHTIFALTSDFFEYTCHVYPVLFYYLLGIVWAVVWIRASDSQSVSQWPWVVNWLDHEHWDFNVLIQVLGEHTIYLFMWVLLDAFWSWWVNFLVC